MIWAILVVTSVLAVAVAVLAAVAVSARRQAADADGRLGVLKDELSSLEAELEAARRGSAAGPTAAAPAAAPGATPAPTPAAAKAADEGGADGITDTETGLFNEEFFRVTLESRVAVARRQLRPVAVVLTQVVHGVKEGSPEASPAPPVAEAVRQTLRDADSACRLSDGRFAFILEDTAESGAVWTVERVRRALAGTCPGQTLWAGIACYPAHAFDADELLERAGVALVAAQEWRQDRIEVASVE